AAPTDAGAAHEVELQRGILLLADLVEGDEQRHAVGLFELVALHARRAGRVLRVVAQDLEGQPAMRGLIGHGQNLSSMRSLRPRKRAGSSSSYGMSARCTPKRSDDASFFLIASTSS